jgi:hypothetical protein
MSTISSATAKDPLEGSEYLPISGTPKKKISVSSIADYVISLFSNKASTLDYLGVSDSTLQYNSIDVNNGFRKVTHSNKSADFTQAIGAGSKLMAIDVKKDTGAITFWVGTTLNGTELLESSTVPTEDSFTFNKYISADTTIYITVDAGDGDFVISYYKNWL